MQLSKRPLCQVKNFSHNRGVDPDGRAGVKALLETLSRLGYVADWALLNALDTFLPQDRPRVYILALHCKEPGRLASRSQQLHKAMELLAALKVPGPPEDLTKVLEQARRAGQHDAALANVQRKDEMKRRRGRGGLSRGDVAKAEETLQQRWFKENNTFIERYKLDGSWQAVFSRIELLPELQILSPRAKEVLALKLARWSQKNEKRWDLEQILVTDPSQTIGFCPLQTERFPCLTPKGCYVVIQRGKAHVANAFECLATQGVQTGELARHRFHNANPALLQDMAGNAFTVNVLIAVLLAGLSHIDENQASLHCLASVALIYSHLATAIGDEFCLAMRQEPPV